MENQFKILGQALDAANKQGVYTLQESATIFQAFQSIVIQFQQNKEEAQSDQAETKKGK